ncbi:hypothetical protein K438DRAFT_1992317 [Mycena galopus ATCC 62051]|nr:hypothetical protein K438DRAFT_1992317 [Mycena galopus ATCC 62051]
MSYKTTSTNCRRRQVFLRRPHAVQTAPQPESGQPTCRASPWFAASSSNGNNPSGTMTMAARAMTKTTRDAVCKELIGIGIGPRALPGEDDVRFLALSFVSIFAANTPAERTHPRPARPGTIGGNFSFFSRGGRNDIRSTFVLDPNTLSSVRLLLPFLPATASPSGATASPSRTCLSSVMRDEIHENGGAVGPISERTYVLPRTTWAGR